MARQRVFASKPRGAAPRHPIAAPKLSISMAHSPDVETQVRTKNLAGLLGLPAPPGAALSRCSQEVRSDASLRLLQAVPFEGDRQCNRIRRCQGRSLCQEEIPVELETDLEDLAVVVHCAGSGPRGAQEVYRLSISGTSSTPSSVRSRLLAEAVAFIRLASQLPGVTRIALIGSLTTSKSDPKDADLLVTVTNGADLAPLAALGRKLAGRAQSLSRGADVFLADPTGTYLGRTCHWRECRPGIRAGCDAIHCGRRPHLHDDLETVTLTHDLIAAPPLEVWPGVVARVPIPDDVKHAVAAFLRSDTARQP